MKNEKTIIEQAIHVASISIDEYLKDQKKFFWQKKCLCPKIFLAFQKLFDLLITEEAESLLRDKTYSSYFYILCLQACRELELDRDIVTPDMVIELVKNLKQKYKSPAR